MSNTNDSEKAIKALEKPKRNLVTAVVFTVIAAASFTQVNNGTPNFGGLVVFGAVAAWFYYRQAQVRKLLNSLPASTLQAANEAIEEKRSRKQRGLAAHEAIKADIQQGNEVYGKVLLNRSFGFGTIRIYANGYIYSSTRMSSPEKLISISSNSTMMNANPHSRSVTGGLMLSIQTESQVFTIKEMTNAKSQIFTPGDIKAMQEIEMVARSVIR